MRVCHKLMTHPLFISENGKPLKKASGVRYVSADKELHHLELASGSYQFDIRQK